MKHQADGLMVITKHSPTRTSNTKHHPYISFTGRIKTKWQAALPGSPANRAMYKMEFMKLHSPHQSSQKGIQVDDKTYMKSQLNKREIKASLLKPARNNLIMRYSKDSILPA